MTLNDFLSPAEQLEIVQAIEYAETLTSGEIRVHVEPSCIWGNAYERAIEVFNELGMYRTQRRNGVLIYIAFNSHHLAIIGDSGINSQVPEGFWANEINILSKDIASNRTALGVCEVIKSVGQRLAEIFPPDKNDTNEQPNEISFTDNNEK